MPNPHGRPRVLGRTFSTASPPGARPTGRGGSGKVLPRTLGRPWGFGTSADPWGYAGRIDTFRRFGDGPAPIGPPRRAHCSRGRVRPPLRKLREHRRSRGFAGVAPCRAPRARCRPDSSRSSHRHESWHYTGRQLVLGLSCLHGYLARERVHGNTSGTTAPRRRTRVVGLAERALHDTATVWPHQSCPTT